MTDCSECWKTPCVCGHAYKYYSVKEFSNFIANMLQLRAEEEAEQILEAAKKIIKEQKFKI